MNYYRFGISILLVVFFISLDTKNCPAEEDVSQFLSENIVATMIPYSEELPQCKKLFLMEQSVEAAPAWGPDFYKTFKKELSQLGYEFVDNQNEAACTMYAIFGFFDYSGGLYNKERSELKIDKDERFQYLCSLGVGLLDNKKNEELTSYMAYCGVRKDFPVENKDKYIEQIGKIYPIIFKKMLPVQKAN